MLALRRMSEAFGGIQKLAGRAKLNANTLYRTLSPKGNPELKSLKGCSTRNGNAAYSPSPAETRRVNQRQVKLSPVLRLRWAGVFD